MLTTGEETPAARRVFIVEDHPVIQEAYARFIDREADLVVCGAAFRGLDALRDIRRRQGLGPYLPRRLRRRPTLRGWRR